MFAGCPMVHWTRRSVALAKYGFVLATFSAMATGYSKRPAPCCSQGGMTRNSPKKAWLILPPILRLAGFPWRTSSPRTPRPHLRLPTRFEFPELQTTHVKRTGNHPNRSCLVTYMGVDRKTSVHGMTTINGTHGHWGPSTCRILCKGP